MEQAIGPKTEKDKSTWNFQFAFLRDERKGPAGRKQGQTGARGDRRADDPGHVKRPDERGAAHHRTGARGGLTSSRFDTDTLAGGDRKRCGQLAHAGLPSEKADPVRTPE